jgi:hypothetical protein
MGVRWPGLENVGSGRRNSRVSTTRFVGHGGILPALFCFVEPAERQSEESAVHGADASEPLPGALTSGSTVKCGRV